MQNQFLHADEVSPEPSWFAGSWATLLPVGLLLLHSELHLTNSCRQIIGVRDSGIFRVRLKVSGTVCTGS